MWTQEDSVLRTRFGLSRAANQRRNQWQMKHHTPATKENVLTEIKRKVKAKKSTSHDIYVQFHTYSITCHVQWGSLTQSVQPTPLISTWISVSFLTESTTVQSQCLQCAYRGVPFWLMCASANALAFYMCLEIDNMLSLWFHFVMIMTEDRKKIER